MKTPLQYFRDWRAERARVQKLELQLEALTDPTLIDRMYNDLPMVRLHLSIENFMKAITKAADDIAEWARKNGLK